MDRLEPVHFLLSNLMQKASRAPYCFDRCMKKDEMAK